jgi:hypothetical protein
MLDGGRRGDYGLYKPNAQKPLLLGAFGKGIGAFAQGAGLQAKRSVHSDMTPLLSLISYMRSPTGTIQIGRRGPGFGAIGIIEIAPGAGVFVGVASAIAKSIPITPASPPAYASPASRPSP